MRKILLITIGLSVGLLADFMRDASTKIVTDKATGLQWQDDAVPAMMTWISAIDYCKALNLGNKGEWRLPNISELGSLINESNHIRAISSTFVNTASDNYWSSTPSANNANYAFGIDFYDGFQTNYSKGSNYYVRCVRAGQ